MIKLNKLVLKNFKGIKSFELDIEGQNVTVYGDNATGKTTLYDAFLWLLFDKDSLNRSNFGIKTLDLNGKVINGLDHEVEAVLDVDGKQLILKKVYREKWTKKKGSAQKVFSGHTTDYFINDVPVKKKEYTDKIAELADENIFRLLTDPKYFNEQLHWQDRRKLLLEVCGDISDSDVIASNQKLAKLAGVLDDRGIDDYKKMIAAKRKKINEQLEKIPIRIDEVQNSMSDVSEIDFDRIQKQIDELLAIQNAHRETISRIENGSEIAQKEKKITEIDAELMKLKIAYEEKKREALKDLQKQADGLDSQYNDIRRSLLTKTNEAETKKKEIERTENAIEALRQEWYKVNIEEFEYSQDTVCPTCGQAIPEWQLEEAREKALEAFNLKKSQRLEKISEEGKATAAELEKIKIIYNDLVNECKEIQLSLNDTKEKLDAVTRQIDEIKSKFEDVSSTPEYKTKEVEKQQLKQEIANLKAGNKEEIEKIRSSIVKIDTEIRLLQADLAKKNQIENAEARIKELKAEEKKLAKELEALDEQLYLTEEFIKTKVKLLEDKINSKFKMARFKLFDIQVNGGVNECCETVYKGVPYSDLNNAARINVGLDIINTLSEHYNFSAPIFVDNRESVTKLTNVNAQVISLVVSESDKKLRVELEEKEMREAV